MSVRPSFARLRMTLLISALGLLLPSILLGQVDVYRSIEQEYVRNGWRFRTVRTFEDLEDLTALQERLATVTEIQGFDSDTYTNLLCLKLAVRRALEQCRLLDRTRTDPGMVIPTGDVFHRALTAEVREKDPLPAPELLRGYFTRLCARLEEAPDRIRKPRKSFIASARKRAEALHRAVDNDFHLLLTHRPSEEREGWKRLKARLHRALTAYRGYLKALFEATPDPTPEESRAMRRAQFDFRLRYTYGVDFDADVLFRRGARFFLDTIAELEAQAKRIHPEKTWQEILRDLEEDHPARGEILSLAKRSADEALAFVIKKDLMTVPPHALEFDVLPGKPRGAVPFAHYQPARGKRRAAFVAVPCGKDWKPAEVEAHLRANHRYWMRAVALHEAVPGHHLQYSIAGRVQHFIRRFVMASTYVEGWGLYSEVMMARNGYFSPKGRLNQLRMKLWRAARVLSAVGMDLHGMSREAAAALLRDRVLFKPMHARKEVEMHRKRPTYFVAYALGFWQIEDLRETLKEHWGEGFSDKRFHDTFLAFGPIPIPIIKTVLTRKPPPPARGS
ncbi:MAG: DUF885 domain-containing protein [Planctomycetota bacterium]